LATIPISCPRKAIKWSCKHSSSIVFAPAGRAGGGQGINIRARTPSQSYAAMYINVINVDYIPVSHFIQVQRPAMSEKLCLKWNDFQDNTNSAFASLRNDNDFSDVTLACEDGKQVEAHKVILAASSPFFQTLLRRNKHPHPLIYMRGLNSEDLVAIVDFLYYGEAKVNQENIESFLALAEELNLKGLTANGDTIEKEEENIRKTEEKRTKSKPVVKTETTNEENSASLDDNYKLTTDTVATGLKLNQPVTLVSITDIQELDDIVKSMMAKSQNNYPNRTMKMDTCTVCGKEGMGSAIKDHIEANHLEGVSLPCNNCEKTFRCRSVLRTYHFKQPLCPKRRAQQFLSFLSLCPQITFLCSAVPHVTRGHK